MARLSFVVRPLAVLLFLATLSSFAGSTADPKQSVQSTPLVELSSSHLLPAIFAGWQLTGTPQESTSSETADSAAAAVLREYGLTRYEAANYQRDHDTLAVKAMEFGDATGAFGAFTFYRQPNMVPEQVGEGGAFDGVHVLFWKGTVLVDAKFNRLSPMSAAELRDLATELPRPVGNQGTLPLLPDYLPPQHIEPRTIEYAIGPAAYQLRGGVLPPALVDFNRSAEVVTAQYNAFTGIGTLTIINYPTPEIAIDREHAIRAFFASRGKTSDQAHANNPAPHALNPSAPTSNLWTQALAESNPSALQVRRSGPLLAITSGGFSGDAAQEMLQRVHYEANLTLSNSKPYVSDPAKVVQIILNVALLVGIFIAVAIVAGVSLGGGRVWWRKMRGKKGEAFDDSSEFIRLNLRN